MLIVQLAKKPRKKRIDKHGGNTSTGVAQSENFVETCESQHLKSYQAERDHTPQWGISFTLGRKSPPKLSHRLTW